MTGGTINTGHLLAQLGRALTTNTQHQDAATRERAASRVARWSAVLEGVTQGSLAVGSRTPVAGLPAWVTLEVIRGGFATGNAAASGPLQAHEVALLDELGHPPDEAARAVLNTYFLGDEGRARLVAMLRDGGYRVQVPEEGALLVVAWLIERGHTRLACDVLEPLIPFLDRLRFYPVPAPATPEQGSVVHLHTVGEIRDELRPLAGLSDGGPRRGQIGPMNEALRYWCPLSDQVVALWLETIEGELPAVVCDDEGKPRRRPDGNPVVSGGWPGASFPAGWRERARELVSEYARLRAKHHLSGKPEKPRESFARLRGYLERVLQGKPLERRDTGAIRALLAGILAKRGGPDSERLKKIRAAQEDQASMPSHWVLYQVLLRRLDALPGERALSSLEGVLAPVSAEEAAAFDLPVGVAMPAHLRDKMLRCMEAPVSELIAEGVIPSGEVLARVLPQITAQVQSASLDDPELRRLYGALYAAFRRRRSLLLLSMAEQVQLGELPWVSALGGFRQPLGGAKQARQTLEQVVTLALGSFPQEILPNKLLQELRALVSSAGLAVPLVDELAADIFLGQFSGKFVEAAQIAARLLRGTLYERYYGLPFDQVLALPRASDSQPSVGFAALCTTLAQADAGGRWSAARNGTIIEQQQLLTTQNLAPLFVALDLRQTLGPRLPELARRCFSWVCLSVERPVDDWHARLLVLKNAAYAWRQMMFFLSLCSPAEQASFMAQADEQMTAFDEVFRLCFRPALEGLRGVLAGGKFDDEGRLGEGRRLLGWSTRRHWLG